MIAPDALPKRFVSKMKVANANWEECWIWVAQISPKGYGRYWDGEKRIQVQAHRFSYEFFHGPIPSRLQIDHLCRVRECVNPDHLEPVTPFENMRRGQHGVLKTHCAQGHLLVEPNLRLVGNRKYCRACMRAKYSPRGDGECPGYVRHKFTKYGQPRGEIANTCQRCGVPNPWDRYGNRQELLGG